MQLTEQERLQLAKIRKAKFEILFTSKDSDGNFLIYNMGQLYLRNEGDDKNKKIGNIYYVGDTVLYSKWETQDQIFRKMDAWSIPLLIAKNVDVLLVKTPERNYWITYDKVKILLKEKKVGIMKFEGYEKKIYIPRTYWSPDTVINEEEHQMTMLAYDPMPKTQPNMPKYIERVGKSWASVLHDYFETPYMTSIGAKLAKARKNDMIIYPESKDVFRAFRMTPYNKIKVVVIAQDPFHDGNATGIAFECKKNITPSTRRIIDAFTEQFPNHFSTDIMEGKLDRWSDQGVFLINTALTVRRGEAGSHLEQWSPFTQQVILQLNARTDRNLKPVVYMLWGGMAKQYKPLITGECPIIEREHPIAGAYRGGIKWKHDNCFHAVNKALREMNIEEIDWT